ncbi:hypothetical protein J18TS1_27270 [Oceanobacillus oncorhynchi subsp. incaldanensis]|nr:hypothetical protein J18TS1_27270 [Oceanobacillus oncorhynchi subsp. incaldanensis]
MKSKDFKNKIKKTCLKMKFKKLIKKGRVVFTKSANLVKIIYILISFLHYFNTLIF